MQTNKDLYEEVERQLKFKGYIFQSSFCDYFNLPWIPESRTPSDFIWNSGP